MRIICPSCASEYEVPAVAPGRIVRCARCGVQWPPVPAAPPRPEQAAPQWREPSLPRPEPPFPQPSLAAPSLAAPLRASPLLLAAWVGSAVLALALLAAFVVERAPIMLAWPPSARLYAALGLG